MSIEHAREGIEHAHHESGHGSDKFPQRVAVLIAILAAILAVTEMSERGAQNNYLTHHISLSDQWSFYGFKQTRSRLMEQSAVILASLPGAEGNPGIQKAIEDAKRVIRRMREGDESGPGTAQIEKLAREQEHERDHAHHVYERFEMLVGVLQIAIVLASVSVVTKVKIMAWIGGGIGLMAGAAGLLVRLGMF